MLVDTSELFALCPNEVIEEELLLKVALKCIIWWPSLLLSPAMILPRNSRKYDKISP